MKKTLELSNIKVLAFDVFGTVVDWHSSIVREVLAINPAIDADAFALAWRSGYAPAMRRVMSGELGWTLIDDLHRLILDDILSKFGMTHLTEVQRQQLNLVWHRLEPWPDVLVGLTRLKTKFTITTLSNGNIGLLTNMAKRAGLPWDAILGAEVAGAYKPQPEAYLRTADILGLRPEQVCLVAAHNNDLAAARACGLATAFVLRATEHGPAQTMDLAPSDRWDFIASDFGDLATQLGC